MNARRCTLLLVIATSLVLASCAIRQAPVGADIMPESARAKIPGSWAGPHRSGAVVPNWIRTFGDPELTALVADAIERNPDLKAAAARVEASRAAVRIAASSLYPRIAMKGLGERQGQRLSGDIGRNINPPDFGSSGVENSGGAGLDTSADETSQRWVYGIAAGAAPRRSGGWNLYPVAIRPACLLCDVPSARNRTASPPVCPRNFSNAVRTSSQVSAASQRPFIG